MVFNIHDRRNFCKWPITGNSSLLQPCFSGCIFQKFSKLNIRFPQSHQKHYFSAPGIIFIQTLAFKKNKPVQKRNKAQHQGPIF